MAEGRYTLSDIAQMVGFSDQNYFSKVFRTVTGSTPQRLSEERPERGGKSQLIDYEIVRTFTVRTIFL